MLSRNSVALRVITFSTVLAIIAFLAIATLISSLYRDASEKNFEGLLSAHLFNLIGSAGIGDTGTLEGNPDLGDFRYTVPNSGWYWAVEPVSGNVTGGIRSLSMTEVIPAPPPSEEPFDREFRRSYDVAGIDGELVRVVESEFFLDSANGAARFRVMGNLTELENEIADFRQTLYLYLATFGIGMIAINAIAILAGLRPLDRLRDALTDIRAGKSDRLEGRFPDEVAPLVGELNALIENNRTIVERARTQVGNLAHSLKTPLAVLANEGTTLGNEKGGLVAQQAEAMRTQIDHYLQRARIAAQRNTIAHRTDAGDAINRMVRVMKKLNQDITFEFELPEKTIFFRGEREDLEEVVGNILENASKWASSHVEVALSEIEADDARPRFVLSVDDDGPGIPEDKAPDVLKRGHRLDEATPGTGLGLSIVSDLVSEYGGSLKLGRSGLGGLAIRIELPRSG